LIDRTPHDGTRAFYWQHLLDDGVVASGTDIAKREGLHPSTVNELLRLTLLEPALVPTQSAADGLGGAARGGGAV
jgi:hypothetical protein